MLLITRNLFSMVCGADLFLSNRVSLWGSRYLVNRVHKIHGFQNQPAKIVGSFIFTVYHIFPSFAAEACILQSAEYFRLFAITVAGVSVLLFLLSFV